ncbi:hypothetical protein LAZ67_12000499 [Cordylochernes scorpioides]|uniref:FBXO47 ARM repeats region domain-containing protein n=1 Tax=Cordylochernes scorpioides TaxID=51811 RepID=A0ABY6L0L2_9ARAC|nr:hypothetical protein LAZ67_12000499 [Cordylochernes scorpioides]
MVLISWRNDLKVGLGPPPLRYYTARPQLEIYVRTYYRQVYLDQCLNSTQTVYWLTCILKPLPIVYQSKLLFILYGPTTKNISPSHLCSLSTAVHGVRAAGGASGPPTVVNWYELVDTSPSSHQEAKTMLFGLAKSLALLENSRKAWSTDDVISLVEELTEATLDRSNVYRWYKMFSEGREDVNDEERAGRPSTSTTAEKINEVEKMILGNGRITVREVSEDLNISIGSCHSIFINDLGMRRVATKFVPKLLNCDQKQHRMNIANEMLDSVRDEPNLLQRVITGDEAWVYGYDVETKAQSSQWKLPHEPRPKKARQVRSNVKVLLTVFFDCRGVVHHEFLPQGRTVKKEYYLQVMRNLREAIRQKLPDLWKNKNWLLHHDNAPAHTSLLVRDFLAKNNTLMMPQPPYSPDLAPCEFFLFPKLKRPMKGRRYATLDEIKTASKEELKKTKKKIFLKKNVADTPEDWNPLNVAILLLLSGERVATRFMGNKLLNGRYMELATLVVYLTIVSYPTHIYLYNTT